MTMRLFNITNLIKASMMIIFALMLNFGYVNTSNAQWGVDTSYQFNATNYAVSSAVGSETGKKAAEDAIQQEVLSVTEVKNAGECSAAVFRAQHSSGCWSCLVLERLTSAFLNAAKHGLPITQKIGIGLLIMGTILWLLKWGLDNVSSFTKIQIPNILNTLFVMCFKVLLAYWFIVLSSTAISQYFVRPIMSVGAIIGQNMWDAEVKEQTVPWDDLADVDITKEVEQAEAEQKKEGAKEAKEGEINQEALDQLEARREKDSTAKSDIPPFQMPGCSGTITSFPGCRVPPPTNSQTNCGSFSHMGLDVSAQNGTPIWAVAGGDIVYSKSDSWGNMVKITTKHKGATWTHLYAHMNDKDWNKYKEYFSKKGNKVARGEIIGGVGNTGQSGGNHLHIELILNGSVGGKQYSNVVVEPMSLAEGKIVERGKKSGSPTGAAIKEGCTCGANGNPGCSYHGSWNPISKAAEVEKKKNKMCRGFKSSDPQTSIKKGSKVPNGGVAGVGVTVEPVMSADSTGPGASGFSNYSAPTIPEISYTGPTNIVPKSIMESLLGAMRVITNTTADNMVLGKMIMCYAGLPNGGAWKINLVKEFHIPNVFMWLQGVVILVAGFLLTASIAFYFLDISFKLGFCVLVLPITAGLWPFKMTEKKINDVITIMMKASASFAFMALITSYGMALVSESMNNTDVLYEKIEKISEGASDAELDELTSYISETIGMFSSTFILMLFALYYFYMLVSKTVNKFTGMFFKDAVFGDKNPMHGMATKAVSGAYGFAKKPLDLAKDIAKTQASRGVKKLTARATAGAMGAAGAGARAGARALVGLFKGKDK